MKDTCWLYVFKEGVLEETVVKLWEKGVKGICRNIREFIDI